MRKLLLRRVLRDDKNITFVISQCVECAGLAVVLMQRTTIV